jgi:CRP-like cAMP-binding protein
MSYHFAEEMAANVPVSQPVAGTSPGSNHADLAELIAHAVPGARPETRRLLQQTARIRKVAPDEIVFLQGEPIPLTLIAQGYGAFRRTTTDGRQLVIGLATRGDLFGYSSLASRPAPVDLVAVTDGELALWSGPDLRPLVGTDGGFALDVIDGIARFIVNLAERVDGFIHQDARQRVLRVLATYGYLFFEEPAVLPRAYLSRLVGTSREMTGRVIRQLEREGVLARVGRTGLQLLSPDLLREAAGSPSAEAS